MKPFDGQPTRRSRQFLLPMRVVGELRMYVQLAVELRTHKRSSVSAPMTASHSLGSCRLAYLLLTCTYHQIAPLPWDVSQSKTFNVLTFVYSGFVEEFHTFSYK